MLERFYGKKELFSDPKADPPRTGIFPFSSQTAERMIADGEFPKPVRLSKRRLGWRESDIKQYSAGLEYAK